VLSGNIAQSVRHHRLDNGWGLKQPNKVRGMANSSTGERWNWKDVPSAPALSFESLTGPTFDVQGAP